MKLTWFSKTAFRFHLGGHIVVVDPHKAPGQIDVTELVSGADYVVRLDDGCSPANGRTWTARPAQRFLDADEEPRAIELWTLGHGSLLIDADDERPLLVLEGTVPDLGRWASKAVIILCGDLGKQATQLLDQVAPHLIGLAGSDADVDVTFDALRDKLDGTGLVALEPGLAVEA